MDSFFPDDNANELVKFAYFLLKRVSRMKPERISNPSQVLSLLITDFSLNDAATQNLPHQSKLELKAMLASQVYMYAFHKQGTSTLNRDIERFNRLRKPTSSAEQPQPKESRLIRSAKKHRPLFNYKTEFLTDI